MSHDRSKGSRAPAGPKLSEGGLRTRAAQKAREAAALRQNLARRKQQQRARAAMAASPEPSPSMAPHSPREEADEQG